MLVRTLRANANYTNSFKLFFVKYVFLNEISIKKPFRVNCYIVPIIYVSQVDII